MSLAFVAGATGYTGREVVRILTERGVRTVAHVRPDSARLADWQTRFGALGAEVDATPWTPDAMAERLGALQPTHVFALLGTTSKRGKQARASASEVTPNPHDTYDTVDYGLTRLLVQASVAAGCAPRFVYLSSTGVSENARGAYLQARWKAEHHLRASGLPYTIARPSFITGTDRDEARPGERAMAMVTDGLVAVAGALGARGLRARYRSTTNATLAAALVRLALDPAAENTIVESESLRG